MKLTICVLLLVAIVLISFDFYTAFFHGTNTTISWVIWTYALKYPFIPFTGGFLCGHLFWRLKED